MKKSPELETYKDAVWDYLLEHCDITDNGSFFVKFHTKNRAAFEKHIRARWKYGYHRKDDRLNLTHEQKEKDAQAKQEAHQSRKIAKKRKRQLSIQEQRAAMKKLEEQRRIAAMSPVYRFIHTRIMQPLAKAWYNKINM